MLKEDPDFEQVIAAVEQGRSIEIRLPRLDKKLSSADFLVENSQLKLICENGSLVTVVSRQCRKEIFHEHHHGILAGHFNAHKMYNQLKKIVFWPGIRQDVTCWCEECQKCFLTNVKKLNVPPLTPSFSSRPFQVIGVDPLEMGPTWSGNRYIVTIIDQFTKHLGAYAVPNKKAETIAEVLFSKWICEQGKQRHTSMTVVRSTSDVLDNTIHHSQDRYHAHLQCTSVILFRVPQSPQFPTRTVYELARALTIIRATHLNKEAICSNLLSPEYVVLGVRELALAISFMRTRCVHIMLAVTGRMNAVSKEEHPRLTDRDPSDIKKIYEIVFDQAIHMSWSEDTWRNVPQKKSLILFPDGFQPQCAGLEYPSQMAYCYTKPEDIRSEWFEQELSAVILFTEPTLTRLSHWLPALHNILKAVGTGAEWIIVPGPHTNKEWEKAVDQIRDIAEGKVIPCETLKPRIKVLLPQNRENWPGQLWCCLRDRTLLHGLTLPDRQEDS
ncbi:hypothetical protein TELCIR_19220 [Teladorsagia circumcincta]|uniref:Integrase zinc-binding domain-containing protein n=1 Tax=Teladorsagia circumcincta TaxID=45464 RepID=A0A2G9TPU2_TELCI|nr:hypothetical protein TELCIR_19220 [Teladorsagia circumcincta]